MQKVSKNAFTLLISPRRLYVMPLDFAFWLISLVIAAQLRFEFRLEVFLVPNILILGVIVAGFSVGFGFVTHLYRARFKHGSLEELIALTLTVALAAGLAGGLSLFWATDYGLPRSLVFIAAPIFLLLSGGLRAYLRYSRVRQQLPAHSAVRSIIYGAGSAAETLIDQLLVDSGAPYLPVALLDDAPEKSNRWIRGVPMLGGWSQLGLAVEKTEARVLIVAIPSADSDLLTRVYRESRLLGLRVVVLPTLPDYLSGKQSFGDMRDLTIEDLMGREQIQLDQVSIGRLVGDKVVLVTGAGGSIGSELVRQISDLSPSSLVLVDRDETGLLSAAMGIAGRGLGASHQTHLADIRDHQAIDSLFDLYKPDVVFHAAALKHVSMLERFPREAWKTNVQGTLNVLRAARRVGVSSFINISTDKAANPLNTLGKSKRLGEHLTSWFGVDCGKPYVSVRFGNVLGSRGSLIPILVEQISRGGPVTLTDAEATRYFMSIPEACQLVLQAASGGAIGDVLVLDMGDPVAIQDIAEKMIELSGRDIEIAYSGLRPGEKLHEDLLEDGETLVPSEYPKIFRIRSEAKSPEEVLAQEW
jgi:FlaA1/EpsC-like NDP-sugar epimerase